MKKIIALSAGIIFSLNVFSQAPNWQWAYNNTAGANDETGNSIAVDNNGNSYITGTFTSPSVTIGATTLNNAGGFDMFIAKYDAAGNNLWAKSIGASNYDFALAIAVDDSSNAIMTGYYFSDSIAFGSHTIFNTQPGTADMFIAKYSPAGNAIWAKDVGEANGDEMGKAIDIDGSGNCYISGDFFGPSMIFSATDSLINNGSLCFGGPTADVFIAKYSANGNFVWARSGSGTSSSDQGNAITVDDNGVSCITGFFRSSTITFGNTDLTNAGGTCNCECEDFFIAKYDAAGTNLWAKSAGGSTGGNAFDAGSGIAHDADGNYYVTGSFVSSSITFGSVTLTNAFAGGGSEDFFIVKYSPSGNVIWAKSAGGSDVDWGWSVATNANGISYVTGGFYSTSMSVGSTTLTNAGSSYNDFFIAKYDSSGNVLFAESAGGINDDYGTGAGLDAGGNCYLLGGFNSPSISIGTTTLTNSGGYDFFITKIESSVGINETIGIENTFLVFPNPATNQLTIENVKLKIEKAEVINVMGQKAFSYQPSGICQSTIDVSSLAPGVYFVKARMHNGELVVKKFVKE